MPFQVTVHKLPTDGSHKFVAYELGNTGARNALVFVGGLTDGPHTVPYVPAIADKLTPELDYSIFELRMTSSYSGFGHSSLAQDVHDLSLLVQYLRDQGRAKIVMMGHSTGCQDCMEYANYEKYNNPPVDGFIVQAPVSDREAVAATNPEATDEVMSKALAYAASMIALGKGNDSMPRDMSNVIWDTPISAYRFESFHSKGGDDDYFSSDLSPEFLKSAWGRFTKPILVLHSGNDKYVPSYVDVNVLRQTWKQYSDQIHELSGNIPGASHNVKEVDSQPWLVDRVVKFLEALVGQ